MSGGVILSRGNAGCFNPTVQQQSDEIVFEIMRASGTGGQHINQTESAVRATYVASSISVKVQTRRSQHKLAQQEQHLQANIRPRNISTIK
ncbi:peptide chain release factor-like protein [Snodgrassella communis]|uniref:peptide chain release factor-like protein n=1 Tax=Snodgrassella communis TaxID=2946699 RepID=UPI002869FB7A|nr:peptide chain release factor-like protein [Snodgrassella communis]